MLEEALCGGPKFMRTFCQTSKILERRDASLKRRKQLIEIADHYGVPIVEDDLWRTTL